MRIAEVREWCQEWLGAPPVRELFHRAHLSAVLGVDLADGRAVVIKGRSPAGRIQGCVEVQRRLSRAGYACPAPLTDAVPLGSWTATAETYLPGGVQLGRDADRPRLFAEALARFVRLAPAPEEVPSVAPAPPWVGWEHGESGVWPWPDNMPANMPANKDADLNARPGPGWLDDLGHRVRERLLSVRLPYVIGHGDWESQNLRWLGHEPYAVHDWDSVVALPEAAVAGAAGAVFTETGAGFLPASLTDTEHFLTAYGDARGGGGWTDEEWEVAWAAGLWVRAFNAKKSVVAGDGSPLSDLLSAEAKTRLRLSAA